jgi:hypothetical protein
MQVSYNMLQYTLKGTRAMGIVGMERYYERC